MDETYGLLVEHFLRSVRLAATLTALTVLAGLAWPSQLAVGPASSLLPLTTLTIIAGVAVVLAVRRRGWGRSRYPLALTALAVTIADTVAIPEPLIATAAHQTLGSAGWIWVALFVDHAFAPAVGFIAVHHAAAAVALLATAAERHALFAFVFASTAIVTLQLTLCGAAAALRGVARQAAASATRRSELDGREAMARQLHADRDLRYSELRASALPLLQTLADGVACPSDPAVQLRAAQEAARMRRLFAEADDTTDQLVDGLRAAASVAERRGVVVHLTVIGHAATLPAAARRRLIDEVTDLLLTTRGQARITVVAEPDVVSIDVVTRTTAPAAPPEPRDGVTVTHQTEGDTLWMQARWTPTAPRS